jgi:RimJ/RimL family protein N-acetyltransferase
LLSSLFKGDITMVYRGMILLLSSLIGLAVFGAATATALPPRPTPIPTATAMPGPSLSTGATIRLRVEGATADAWTTVEWQDAAGNWHLVGGWQGTLETDRTKTWWVAASDFGRGPFRWVVADRRGGEPRGFSSAFNLPISNRQVVEVTLTIVR